MMVINALGVWRSISVIEEDRDEERVDRRIPEDDDEEEDEAEAAGIGDPEMK